MHANPSLPDPTPTTTLVGRAAFVAQGAMLQVVGEIDMATAPHLASVLDELAVRTVDLSGVTFFGAAGASALVAAAGRRGSELTVVRASEPVLKTLRLTGELQVFPMLVVGSCSPTATPVSQDSTIVTPASPAFSNESSISTTS